MGEKNHQKSLHASFGKVKVQVTEIFTSDAAMDKQKADRKLGRSVWKGSDDYAEVEYV